MGRRSICSVSMKALQRKFYDFLSHRHGIKFILLGIILLLISVIQFGEILLLWSQKKYAAMLDNFSDNIAGITFRERMCLPIPIDVVYTWVNGSDPLLLKELNAMSLLSKQERRCPLKICIPTNFVKMTPSFPHNMPLKSLSILYPFLAGATSVNEYFANDNNTVLQLRNEENVELMMSSVMKIDGKNVTKLRGYFTNTSIDNADHSKFGDHVVVSLPQTGSFNVKDFEVYVKVHLNISIKEMFGHSKYVATAQLASLRDVQRLFEFYSNQKTVMLYSVKVVWMDMQDDWEEPTAINRFQDNEELRYSLRSVEKYAPWVRNVYLVTNGQIPYWLNLENPRVKIISHYDIFTNLSHLPTYSSPAIETHIHRIDGLSRMFIYMNDDVMFGRPVWPDDFFTHSGGYKLYLTYPIPNCHEGCPGSWIKDGYCDRNCNNTECDWDGGDCVTTNTTAVSAMQHWPNIQSVASHCNPGCGDSWLADRYCDISCNVKACGYDAGDCGVDNYGQMFSFQFLKHRYVYNVSGHFTFYANFSLSNFEAVSGKYERNIYLRTMAIAKKFHVMTVILRNDTNVTTSLNMQLFDKNNNTFDCKILFYPQENKFAARQSFTRSKTSQSTVPVDSFFKGYPDSLLKVDLKHVNKVKSKKVNLTGELREKEIQFINQYKSGEWTETGFYKQIAILWEKHEMLAHKTRKLFSFLPWEIEMENLRQYDGMTTSYRSRKLLDVYSDSLRYVNKLYNKEFGFEQRKIPAHMPHLIDKQIIIAMQTEFSKEIEETSAHKVRSATDLQYSFAYYYYIMSKGANFSLSDFFNELDVDNSGVLSDREVRTLATRLFDLPLELRILTSLEQSLINCSIILNSTFMKHFETYYTPNMVPVTLHLLQNCPTVLKKINSHLAKKSKYKFQVLDDALVKFKMIHNNASRVITQLDDIRKNPSPFICVNDDIDHTKASAVIIRNILLDFFETQYPLRSSFELSAHRRNRFLHMDDLHAWKSSRLLHRRIVLLLVFVIICIILFFLLQKFRESVFSINPSTCLVHDV